jgi:predicted PurR-regulated permease PerM
VTLVSAREQLPEVEADPPVRLAAPSMKAVLRIVAIVVACAIGLYLAWRLRDVLRLVVISVFVALALLPIVDAFDSRVRVPRAAIILALYLALAAGVVVVGVVVVPSMVKQVQQLSRDAPRYTQDLRGNATFRRYDDRYHIAAKLQADARDLPSQLSRATGPLQDITVKAFGVIGQFVTVLSVAFLLMLNGRRYVGMALRLTGSREARYRSLIVDVNQAVARYMLGNVAISLLATVATWLVLTILGVPYALSLGIVVGFFDLIPLVGARSPPSWAPTTSSSPTRRCSPSWSCSSSASRPGSSSASGSSTSSSKATSACSPRAPTAAAPRSSRTSGGSSSPRRRKARRRRGRT